LKRKKLEAIIAGGSAVAATAILAYYGDITTATVVGGLLGARLIELFVRRDEHEDEYERLRTEMHEIWSPLYVFTRGLRSQFNQNPRVVVSVQDYRRIAEIFESASYELGRKNLDSWASLRVGQVPNMDIVRIHLTEKDLKWFDELEKQYLSLSKRLDNLK